MTSKDDVAPRNRDSLKTSLNWNESISQEYRMSLILKIGIQNEIKICGRIINDMDTLEIWETVVMDLCAMISSLELY